MRTEKKIQRLPAEQLYQHEIEALIAAERDPIPTGWKMSPRSVLIYLTGGKAENTVITPKYIGNKNKNCDSDQSDFGKRSLPCCDGITQQKRTCTHSLSGSN